MKQPYEEVDAFPNAPGLSKTLGLTQADDVPKRFRGWGPWREQWFSVCSAHQIPSDCPRCRVGSYRNIGAVGFSQLLCKFAYPVWFWTNNPHLRWRDRIRWRE